MKNCIEELETDVRNFCKKPNVDLRDYTFWLSLINLSTIENAEGFSRGEQLTNLALFADH